METASPYILGKVIVMKIIESDDGMYATVVLEDADAEEMDEEFVKEFIRVAESQKQFK